MSTKRIKVSLLHTEDRTIHDGFIVLDENSSKCIILFTSSVSQNIQIESHDYFQALVSLRIELEKQNYYILCNGSRLDVNCGGMSREYSRGLYGHIMEFGKYIDLDNEVYIFDYTEPDLVVSVKEQKEFNKLHRSSLPEVIGYHTELEKLISSSIQENIIDRLSSHIDWQLLQREGNKLSFKFSNASEQSQWNIEVIIDNIAIDILFTIGNDTKRETFLAFLKNQLNLNGVAYNIVKM